ncbi:hypothetical protein K5Z09_005183 [Escherichia coli]|nr:hypothetical protein [Escherichia coli]EHR8683433.1 hypothetical protein [Escherichia coli]EHR9219804.1 hypothetical protein [Escherichia coli]EIM2936173.1 hypothetical protein [Escherichia coli]EIM2960386.1 hypothetical protein [Escherichia coli]
MSASAGSPGLLTGILTGSACLLSGQAVAAVVDGSLTPFTASATVLGAAPVLTVTQDSQPVSAEDAALQGTVLTQVTVEATGLNPSSHGTNRIDVGAANADGWDSAGQRWIFKNENGETLYATGNVTENTSNGWRAAMNQQVDGPVYGAMRYVADGQTEVTTNPLSIATATTSNSVIDLMSNFRDALQK